jgi:hypothetical protein
MRYIIHESHVFPDGPYTGPSCHAAGVLPGKYYETEAEAFADVAKLEQVNAVGWKVYSIHTAETLQQRFPKMVIESNLDSLRVHTRDIRNPFTINDLLDALGNLVPDRPICLYCDNDYYYCANREALSSFQQGFKLREGLYNSSASKDLAPC